MPDAEYAEVDLKIAPIDLAKSLASFSGTCSFSNKSLLFAATAITKIKFYIISYKNLLVFSGAQSLIWLYQYFLSSSKDSFLVMS